MSSVMNYFRTTETLDLVIDASLVLIAGCLLTVGVTLYLIWRDGKKSREKEALSFFELSLNRRLGK